VEKSIRGAAKEIPANGLRGYEKGEIIILQNAAQGQWINMGTKTSCKFVPHGPTSGYGVALAGSLRVSVNGSATQYIDNHGIRSSDITFVEYRVTNDTDTIQAQAPGNGSITVTCSADPSTTHALDFACVRNGCVPEWDIFAAGTRAAIAGDTTTVPITVTGALASDIAFATITVSNDSDTIAAVTCAANAVNLTVSADPETDHSWAYMVLRPRGTFKPSHYIAYAGIHTTVGGNVAEPITITGALATDIPIVHYNTSNDTDTIVKAVLTANTLTVTTTVDPGVAHKFAYMILRAY